MPVSKGRKPKAKQKEQLQQSTLSTTHNNKPPQLPKTVWEQIRDHPIPSGIALLAAVIAICPPVWQMFVEPEIDISETGEISPFEAPVKVTNESFVFTMRKAK